MSFNKKVRTIWKYSNATPGGSKDPPISATPDDPAEMWKDVIAQRHFQESEGNVTFARMKILDANGRAVVNFLTQSDKREHAEEKAIRVSNASYLALLGNR